MSEQFPERIICTYSQRKEVEPLKALSFSLRLLAMSDATSIQAKKIVNQVLAEIAIGKKKKLSNRDIFCNAFETIKNSPPAYGEEISEVIPSELWELWLST